MTDAFGIILRSIFVYLFIIAAIRLFGKKELTQLSVVDLVFILLISNSVQNAMVGNNSTLLGGLLAATALFLVNVILKDIFFKHKTLSHALQGQPLMLVYQGKIIQKHMDDAKITLEELEAAIREHGLTSLQEVDLAVLEIDGNISVLSDKFRRKTTRRRKAHKVIARNN